MTFRQYKAYFKQLAAMLPEIKSFVHGGSDRIMSASRSDLQYPCFWLETPGMAPKKNDAGHATADRIGGIVILMNSPDADPDAQDLIWEQTEDIIIKVLAQMIKDSKARKINFDVNSAQVDAISTLFVDNDFGWRMEFKFNSDINLC